MRGFHDNKSHATFIGLMLHTSYSFAITEYMDPTRLIHHRVLQKAGKYYERNCTTENVTYTKE
jgi:hypothetical protein